MVGHDYRGHGAHCKGRCGYVQPVPRPAPSCPTCGRDTSRSAGWCDSCFLDRRQDPYDDPNYFDACQAAGVHVDSCICPPAYERTAPK